MGNGKYRVRFCCLEGSVVCMWQRMLWRFHLYFSSKSLQIMFLVYNWLKAQGRGVGTKITFKFHFEKVGSCQVLRVLHCLLLSTTLSVRSINITFIVMEIHRWVNGSRPHHGLVVVRSQMNISLILKPIWIFIVLCIFKIQSIVSFKWIQWYFLWVLFCCC